MRPKELRIIVTFETTTAAMAFESEAKSGRSGKTDPSSKEITSGCGLSFSAPIEEKEQIYNLIQQLQYQQVLELII